MELMRRSSSVVMMYRVSCTHSTCAYFPSSFLPIKAHTSDITHPNPKSLLMKSITVAPTSIIWKCSYIGEPRTYMAWLLVAIFFTVSPSTSTRILSHQPPPPRGGDRAITFFMNDVLGTSRPAAGTGAPPPIAKPMGGRPPATAAFAGQTGPPNKSWLPLLTSLHASALESGTVTMIDETLRGSVALGPPTAGKVQGMYVTSTGDNSSHMVAMKATFEDGSSDDSLRFFGVHHLGLPESHIAVVGGTGRYHGANGFAVVRATGSRESADGVLSVTVYLE